MLAVLLCAAKAGHLRAAAEGQAAGAVTAEAWRQLLTAITEEELRRKQYQPAIAPREGKASGLRLHSSSSRALYAPSSRHF